MPVYEYVADEGGCIHCGYGFDVVQKISDDRLTQCPECGAAVRQRISAPSVQSGDSHRLEPGHFSKRGFTQYKRAGDGVYEKTGGKGPRYIADDGE